MNKYIQIKKFHHGCWFKVYIYNFMYIKPDTISEEEYLTATNVFKTTRKGQILDQSQNIGLDLVAYSGHRLKPNFYYLDSGCHRQYLTL